MPIQIHTKTGKEKEITDILDAYRNLYPKKFRFFMKSLGRMRDLNKNSDGSFIDPKGRWARIGIRVPTELFLFIQHRIEGFGDDYNDMLMLQRVASDFLSMVKRPKRRIWAPDPKRRSEKKDNEDQRGNDSEGRAKEPSGVLSVPGEGGSS
jgi:hypothetical protein